jgi:transposase
VERPPHFALVLYLAPSASQKTDAFQSAKQVFTDIAFKVKSIILRKKLAATRPFEPLSE